MGALTQWISEHPVVGTWITIISLLGVLITVIAFIMQVRSKRKRAVSYTIASTVLIDNKVSAIDGIKVLFQDEEVTTVTVSNIRLWNSGNELLEEGDFYPNYGLKIIVPENEKILAIAVAEQTDVTCNVNVKISSEIGTEAAILFSCLEPRQGATINVYHTNTRDEEIKITGKIKGGKVGDKSIDLSIESGELYMSIGKYKVYFDGGLWSAGRNIVDFLYQAFGISVVKGKKK